MAIDMTTDVKQDRAADGLRTYSERTGHLLSVLQKRMTEKQTTWGEGLTVLNDLAVVQHPLVVRHALSFEKVLREMPIAIETHDLIVGSAVVDGAIARIQMPEYASTLEREQAKREGAGIGAGLSHKTPYYYDVIDRGLLAVVADVDAKLSSIAACDSSVERDEKLALFKAVKIECLAVVHLAHRHADLAQKLAEQTASGARREELLKIADVCRHVPAFPARHFHDAVQSFWFVHYALFQTGTKLSCGRMDQYLYGPLKADLDAGRISLCEAQELIDCLWLRFNDRAQICRENFFVSADDKQSGQGGVVVDRGPTSGLAGHRKRYNYAADAADAINHFGQNILLSGIRPDGVDGTNELTYLCLNALEKFALTSPVVTVRLHKQSPHGLLARTAEVLKKGGGMPYINNDDVLIPAYVDLGVSLADARDYVNSNCWETMIEGKSDQELIRGMNFLLFVELALNRGKSHVYGQMGPDTGDVFACFDDLMAAWKVQMDYQLQQGIDCIGKGLANGTLEHSSHGKYRYNPMLSALTYDCLAKEEDVIRGGARYTIWHVMGEGVANAIDAMAAIKKLVYDDHILTMDGLLTALETNWDGHEDLRQRILTRVPKFANHNDYADDIGREMMGYFVERTRYHAARYPQVIFPASVGTFSWYVKIGKEVGASADGRFYGEAIAGNFSPVPGADMSGPTAAIGSYLKMHVAKLAAGAPLDLRFSSNGLAGQAGTDRLAGLIRAFVMLDGNMLTITVTDAEELKRALVEPEKYRHLRVRMGGWSAYFVMLGEEQQRLHIKRVEHGLM
jgi:formate C-acetyltransferase